MAATNVSFPFVDDKNPNLVYNLAVPSDEQELTEFVMEQFFYRFPLKDVAGFDIEKEIRSWFGKYINNMCSKNYSIILRDPGYGNRIAAAAVNDVVPKIRLQDDISTSSFTDPVQRPGWQKIINLVGELHKDIDWGEDPIISMDFIAVGENYTNRGISQQLIHLTSKLAEFRGIRTVRIDAVSQFMAQASFKAGFQMVKEIDYNKTDLQLPESTISVHKKVQCFINQL